MSYVMLPREPASRRFTDRDTPKSVFQNALQQDSPDGRDVIVWYGVGGQGKTALCECLMEMTIAAKKTQSIALGVCDFDEPCEPVTVLLHLRLALGAGRLVRCPTFDIAFAQLFALTFPGDDIRQRHPGLFQNRESELLSDLIELAQDVSDTFGVKFLYKYGTRLGGWMRDWWSAAETRAEIGRIQKMTATKLREQLPSYLGGDIRRALASPGAPRVVIMLDSYEKLWRETPRGALENLRVDGWVRSLVDNVPGALVVIFCRDKLRWNELSPKWERRLEQHLLGGLSDQDATRFLEEAGIHSAVIRARIVAGAQGLPFYLDLALNTYQDVRDLEQRQPQPEDFGRTPVEVLDRFWDHLSESEIEDLAIASYLEVVDERLLLETSRTLNGRPADWGRLQQRSYMTAAGDGTLRMHALLREACQGREQRVRPQFYGDAHRLLFRHFDGHARSASDARTLRDDHDQALVAATRHGIEAGHLDVDLPTWIMRQELFMHGGRWVTLDRAYALIDEALGPFAGGSRDGHGVWFYHHHATVLQHQGLLEDAKTLFQRARANYPREEGTTPPAPYATILDALGNVCWELGQRSEAEQLYREARRIYETDPGSYPIRYAYVLFNLARCHDAIAQSREAEPLYQAASERFEALAATHPKESGGFLLELGRVRWSQGRAAEALTLLHRALTIHERPDGDPDGRALVLLELAVYAAASDGRSMAAGHFDRAVAAHATAFGPEHPNTGRALHLQAVSWTADDPRYPGVRSQLDKAIEILTESLGDDHVWTIEARADRGHAASAAASA